MQEKKLDAFRPLVYLFFYLVLLLIRMKMGKEEKDLKMVSSFQSSRKAGRCPISY